MGVGRERRIEILGTDIRTLASLSRRLRGRRLALGLTQEEVAEAAGVSVQWLSRFENHVGDFGVRRVLRLAAALDVSLAVSTRPVRLSDQVFAEIMGTDQ